MLECVIVVVKTVLRDVNKKKTLQNDYDNR